MQSELRQDSSGRSEHCDLRVWLYGRLLSCWHAVISGGAGVPIGRSGRANPKRREIAVPRLDFPYASIVCHVLGMHAFLRIES